MNIYNGQKLCLDYDGKHIEIPEKGLHLILFDRDGKTYYSKISPVTRRPVVECDTALVVKVKG